MTSKRSTLALLTLVVAAAFATAACTESSMRQIGPEGTGSLEGTVVVDAGMGVESAMVRITQGREGISDDIRDDSTQTGAGGEFSFSDISAGPWTLQVTPPDGFVRPEPRVVQVPPDMTVETTVTLQPETE